MFGEWVRIVISKKLIVVVCLLVLLVAGGNWAMRYVRWSDADVVDASPTRIESEVVEEKPMTMADVLDLAANARQHMSEHLDDYTTRFVKQDRGLNGVLNEQEEMLMKVQTRLRGDTETAPLRVYMEFTEPESKRGREVIWGEDLNDGKLCVHEVGLLGLKRLNIPPNGLLAMQGQRYPITSIGMVRLLESLIERGTRDLENPHITVTNNPDSQFDERTAELIQIRCAEPRGGEDDFSMAEIVIDRERQLLLMYRSYGWPENEGEDAPLLESYGYHDVQVNVGLTDEDFSPDNPNYNYPKF